jgi:hypothetical protein
MKAEEVLEDHRYACVQPGGVDAFDVNAIPGDGADAGPIEPCQEFRESRLTGTALTDQCHDFAGTNAQRHIAQRAASVAVA